MTQKISLREQLAAYEQGRFLNSEGNEDSYFLFYDWFCSDGGLKGRSERLFPKVKSFLKAINRPELLDSCYLFFKNNCPMNGQLYDDFRICDRHTGDVIYTVVPCCGHRASFGSCEVWGRENGFKEALAITQSWRETLTRLRSRQEVAA